MSRLRILNRIKISTKVFVGFGLVLALLLAISAVSLYGLVEAERNLRDYRELARQTNAEGRVQANMLMTRIYAKDFIISANAENIEKIEERARRTIEMIEQARLLTTNPGYQMIINNLDHELQDYIENFERVTKKQTRRDEIVHGTLNVVGPGIEMELTAIMKSAFDDGDAEAAFWAGTTLRSLMLARLYANRFLIQNDVESYRRVGLEFLETEQNIDELLARLENPQRVERATRVRTEQRIYARAFEGVHDVISSRNEIIQHQLDNIGPRVADQIETLKLALKAEQDDLGPRAEASTRRAVGFTLAFSVASILLAGLAAWVIGRGVSRPIQSMTRGMRRLARGDLEVEVSAGDRRDEIREMAEAVEVFRESMIRARDLSAEQHAAAEEVRVAKEALETLNRDLETKVDERTAALAAAREIAESASRSKSVFLANMSHELRTPMNAILGYSEMLMEDAQADGQEEAASDLKKIHQAGTHLLSLINDVLDLSKIESGKMEILAEDFPIESLLDEVVATAEPLMRKNDNQFRIESGADLGSARQDRTKLRQALLNLLSNAAKFTHEGAVTLGCKRRVLDENDWLFLSVRDDGIGIPADKLERIFEEFGQADETTTRDYGGTGLGLAISRRFCEMLGGDVSVESQPGLGSTFTIRVPAVLGATALEAPSAQKTEPARSDAELAAIRKTGSGRTVLVIDDDPEARDIIQRLLRQDDFVVVTADSGQEGLRLAHALEPAVITLDVMMPEMDGWAVLRALKADPQLRDIPVVMLTILDDKTQGYSLGAIDYLTKPVDREALRKAVSRYHAPEAPRTVLLVDDDAVIRETVSDALSVTGWKVVEAENGREALDQLTRCDPTLILLDLMMPVMDGFDFLVELHANPDWSDIPVIVLTAKDLTAEERRVLSGRVEQVFEKNAWSHEQLIGLVRKLATENARAS